MLLVLHLPLAQRLLRPVLQRALSAAAGGAVTVDSLDFNLWTGRVHGAGVRLARPGLEFTCASLEAYVRRGRGLVVRATEPRLVVSLTPASTPAVPNARPWTVLERVGTIEIVRGALRVQGDDGSPVLRIEGLDAHGTRGEGALTASVVATAIAIGGAADAWRGAVDAKVDLDLPDATRTVRVRSAEATVGEARVRVTGELQQVNPVIGSARLEVPAGMSLLRTFVPGALLEGEIAAWADVLADRSGYRATVVADARAVRVAHVGPWDGRIEGRVEDGVLRVADVDLVAYGGSIRGEGVASADGVTGELRVRGIDLPRVLTSHTNLTTRIASRGDADLRLRLPRWDRRMLEAEGAVTLRAVTGPGIPVRGSARFSADDRHVRMSTAALRVRDVDLQVRGTLGFDGRLDLRYGARVADLSRAQDVLAGFGLRVPRLNLRGALAAEGTVNGVLERWVATARVGGRQVSVEDLDLDVDSELRVTPTSMRLVHLTAGGAEGVVSASGDIPMGRRDAWRISGSLDRLRLDEALARHGVPLDVTVGGRFEVTGERAAPEVAATLAAGVSSRAAPDGTPSAPILVDALVRASGRGVVVDRLLARGRSGTLDGTGRWSAGSGDVEARVRASEFPLTAIPGVPLPPDLESVLAGEFEISGTLPVPTGRGSISATRTAWRGAALPDLRLDVSSDGAHVAFEGSSAHRRLLTGRMPVVAPWPLHLDIDLGALPITELMRAFPALAKRSASATLSGRALIDLELASPSGLRYEARIDGSQGSFTRPWKAGPFGVRGTLDAVSVQDLEMQFGFGRLRIDGDVGLAHETSGRLTIAGQAPLSHLALVTPIEEADGEALVDVTLTGRVTRPSLAGTVSVANGSIRQGALRFDDLQLIATMDERGVEIRQASAQVAGGRVYGTGALGLSQAAADNYRLELHGRGIDLARLSPARDDRVPIIALVDADVQLVSDRLSLDAVRAQGALTSLALSVAGRTLGLAAPVTVSFESGRLTHGPLRLAGSAGGVTLESEFAMVAGQPQLALDVDGEIDLVVANPLLGDSAALDGVARLRGRVEWDAGGWDARGDVRVKDGRVVLTDPAVVMSNVAVTLRAEGERIEVVEGSARVGDGELSMAGRVLLSSAGADVDLALRADRVPLEYPTGLRTRSSADLRLTGLSGAYRLAGDVVVHRAFSELDDARGAPGFDRVSAALTAFEGRGSLRDRTALDVGLRLEDGLRVAAPQISLVVDGAVRAGGTLLVPEIGGSLVFREGGTVRVSRALVRLEGGRIELSGYPARPPEVDVRGITQVSGVGIDVSLSGPLDDVRMNLSSRNRSDLGQGDLATLILTGRTTSAAASESGAIVAEELASSLGRVLTRQLGGFVMFDVSRDESLIPENANSPLRMNIGIPLSNRLYVIYSHSLETGALRWIVDVRPGRDFRLRVISNDDGSEAVEASHHFGFAVWSRRTRPPVVREHPRIRSVSVMGASEREEAGLRSRLGLRPGDEFDHFRSQDAARAARAWFIAQGFLEAAVDVHHETTAGALVDLTVHVVRGPLVRIEWRGDQPGRSVRRRVTEGWNSVLPRDERAARLGREVRRTLRASRYLAAAVTVTLTEETARDAESSQEVRVTFDVVRGPRGAGVELRFEGNASVSDATLAASLPPTNSADFFALLEPEGSRRLASALRVAYATQGFVDARVGTPAESFAGAGERLRVTIPVVEGNRALVVALELPEEVRAAGDTPPVLALRDGAPFRLDAYTADRARLLAWLRDDGYPDARVTSILEPRPGGLAVRFQADAGPRVTMGGVRTARKGRTRPSIIENAVAASPGEVIRASSLDETRQRLNDTRIFRSVDLRLAPVDGREDVRDVVVDVVERSDVNVEYSLRYTTAGEAQVGGAPSERQAGVQVGAGFELVNPFGGADRYRVSGLVGTERQLLNARYDRATFFGWQVPTEVSVYDDRQRLADTEGLAQRVTGATVEQTRRWRTGLDGRRLHERLRLQWGYTIRQVDYASLGRFDTTLTGLRAGLVQSLVGDTRDSVTDPRRGMLWSVTGELALEKLGSDVNYYRAFGQLYLYVPLRHRLTWAQGYRIGIVPGADPLLLLDNRFFAGGGSSVRGFAERSLGPRTLDDEALGGQASAVFNQELRFELWKRLHGAVFYDAGNAFALAGELDLRDLRQTAGAGLRLMFPFGPVRVDWAHVLAPRAGEKSSRFVFSIGHAF